MTTPVIAAGGLLWRPSAKNGVEVALVHRPRYKDWSLPKGKADPGETAPMTAAREVLEETGFQVVLGRSLTTVRYVVSAGPKTVAYFAAQVIGGEFTPNKEVDKLRWLSLADARKQFSYEFDNAVLDTFALHPPTLNSVVLIRHARAGIRESWEGNDASRPLDARGQKQAIALKTELAPFGPVWVSSAPIERCRATVAPLAAVLNVTVQPDDAFSEDSYRHNPAAARRRLTDLAKAGQPVAVCSQGGVIPGVIKSLASLADMKIGQTSTPKCAYWVLTFDGSTMVQADPYPAPVVS